MASPRSIPVDKASNNIDIVYKAHHINRLREELASYIPLRDPQASLSKEEILRNHTTVILS